MPIRHPNAKSRLLHRLRNVEANRAANIVVSVTPAETVVLTETLAQTVNRMLAEAVAWTEARILVVNRAVGETVALTENFVASRIAVATLPEAVALAESLAFSYFKTLPETVVLTESLQTTVTAGSSDIHKPHLQLGCKFHMLMRVGEI